MTSRQHLRIAMTVDPEIPVPPLKYGGIERIVDMLVRELQRRGHEVHLFANGQSTIRTNLVPFPGRNSGSLSATIKNTACLWNYTRKAGPFDVIHSFARLIFLLPLFASRIPKIQSYQRYISPRSVRLGARLGRKALAFTTCSTANAQPVRDLGGRWEIIYNGVDTAKYTFAAGVSPDAPLVFLSRVERIKGAHTAIDVALATKRRLIIAGNHGETGEAAVYFSEHILPRCDGHQIKYVGSVGDVEKNEILGNAAAMLFPVEIEEPFGIVLVEALACGTPVIAFERGAVPEVVAHGHTGFVCRTPQEMIEAVGHIDEISRANCRHSVETKFSERVITDAYEALYYSMLKR